MKAAALGLALLVVALPVLAAPGDLTASTAVAGGMARLAAPLAAAVLANATLAEPGRLQVEVADGTLVLDERRTDVWAGGVGATPANQTSTARGLRDARLHGFGLGAFERLLVLPAGAGAEAPRLDADATRVEAAPAPPGLLRFTPRASHARPAFTLQTAGTLALAVEPQGGAMTVAAPFTLVVWDATFAVEDDGGTQQVATGRRSEPVLGVPGVHRETEAEAYVTVRSGRLTLPAGPWQVHAGSAALDVRAGSLTLSQPAGTLEGAAIPAGSQALRLEAPVAATLGAGGRDGILAIAIGRPPGGASLDGVAVRPAGGTDWWPAALAASIALPAAAMAVAARRQRARQRRLQASMAEQRFADAVADAEAVRRHRPRAQDALVAQALALLHAGRFDEAAALLDRREWAPAAAPMRSFLRAAAAAGRGRRRDAVAHLADCLRREPRMAWEAAAAPLLAGLVREAQSHAKPTPAGDGPARP